MASHIVDRTVLLISHEMVGKHMAGPGIRYYHLATVLARHFNLTLAIPRQPDLSAAISINKLGFSEFPVVSYVRGSWETIEAHVRQTEIVILPSDTAADFPQLAHSDAALVVDGYDPLLPEWLALYGAAESESGGQHWRQRMHALHHQHRMGDFFICASERQRDWWLGLLEAHGRINPWTFREDSSLRRLIDVVAYGLPDGEPTWTRPVLKGVWPGIGPDDKVILWGGGLWLWLDPLTAIRAVAVLWQQRQDVRLVFPGTRHPNPLMGDIGSHNQAAKLLAAELGLLDKAIFFGDWVAYEDWANVLLEADVALSLHFDTVETRLAFRSRVLEYIWAGLPIVATTGDATGKLVEHFRLGTLVDYTDTDAVAQSIGQLLEKPRDTLKDAFAEARRELRWETVAQPLIAFCRQPRRAPDRTALGDTIGNPATVDTIHSLVGQMDAQKQAIAHLQVRNEQQSRLIRAYEQGKFMRFMRWLSSMRPGV